MKFSIITPSFNQACFIEDTILSVLNQNYPDFEHIIVDGGSTDGTVEILKKYPHLKWVSEKDRGQSDAINKGFRMASGDIIAWLNSDDYYETNIFNLIDEFFSHNKDCKFLYGGITFIDINKNVLATVNGANISYRNLLNNPDIIRQPSSFWHREVIEKIGVLNENYHVTMDFDFFLRISKKYKLCYLDKNLSYFRSYSENKTQSLKKKQFNEICSVMYSNGDYVGFKTLKFLLGRFLDSLGEHSILRKLFSPLRKN
jgi:glycosyltransferase involved in cell wall biosynthesis